jgi:hypothetical protein
MAAKRRATSARDSRISPRQLNRAMSYSIVAGGSGAFFLTVINIQPLFNVYLMNHLGVSSRVLGTLVSLMQLSSVFHLVSILAYGLLPRRKPFWLAGHLVHRLAGLAVAISAVLYARGIGGASAAALVSGAMILSWSAANLTGSGWMSWMADLIPEESRGSFFLRRSAVFQGVTVVWFFAASVLLDLVPEESRSWAYAAIFGIGAAGGTLDILLHIAIPEPRKPAPEGSAPGTPAEMRLPSLVDFSAPLRDGNFLRYSAAIGLALLGGFLANPFQAPYLTSPRNIGAPNVWLGIMTVISQLTWVAIAPLWGFVMDRYGRKPAVMLGMLSSLVLVGYVAISPRDFHILLPVIALVGGFFGPAFWEGSGQLMLTLAPSSRRVVYIAWYNTILGLISAVGPITGGYLADALSSFELPVGAFVLRGFHVGQLAGLALWIAAALVLRAVREGRERPVAYLVTQFASAGVFKSYASLGALGRDSSDPRVERALRRLEGEDGELVIKEVAARLDDPSREVREEAARALGRIGSRESTMALVQHLVDPSSAIRIEAARAIGRIGDERAVPPLTRCLAVGSPELRAACAEALGVIGGAEARRALAAAFVTEREHSVVAAGAEAISRTSEIGDAEGATEILEAVQELLPRLFESHNAALKRQYAISIGNLLGRPGEFYRFITGEAAARAERCRTLFESFRMKMEETLGPGPASSGASWRDDMESLSAALDSGSGRGALFGGMAAEADFPEAAGRADLRLGAWAWIASEAARRIGDAGPEAPDDATRLMIALLAMYYLGG